MDDDWESLAEKDKIVIKPPIVKNLNKWEGEDEDEDVKESWEDEEEKKDEEKVEAQPTPSKTKSKKPSQPKLSEKERKDEEERLEKERYDKMSPEEKLAEKLRLQQIEKESDFKNALDTFGVSEIVNGLDAMNPTTKEEFVEFADALTTKITNYKNDEEYAGFIEILVRNTCAHLSSSDLRKIKITIDSLHLEKQKMEREKTKKPAAKGKTKIKLRVETDIKSNIANEYDGGYDHDDYDDFM